jgi:hypothetical protein
MVSTNIGHVATKFPEWLLQAYFYTHSVLTDFNFEVLPVSSYTLRPSNVLLETFLELLLWNKVQSRHHIFLDVFNILKYSSL